MWNFAKATAWHSHRNTGCFTSFLSTLFLWCPPVQSCNHGYSHCFLLRHWLTFLSIAAHSHDLMFSSCAVSHWIYYALLFLLDIRQFLDSDFPRFPIAVSFTAFSCFIAPLRASVSQRCEAEVVLEARVGLSLLFLAWDPMNCHGLKGHREGRAQNPQTGSGPHSCSEATEHLPSPVALSICSAISLSDFPAGKFQIPRG